MFERVVGRATLVGKVDSVERKSFIGQHFQVVSND